MKRKISFSILPLIMLGIACSSEARVNSLTGGLDVTLDIDNRTNKNTQDTGAASVSKQDDDFQKMVTTPSLRFKSDDIKDSIELKYAPGLKYDLNGKGTDVDQKLDFSAQRLLMKEWQIKISDLYIKTDDSTQTSNGASSTGDDSAGNASNGSSDQLSNQLGRQRFWKNDSSLVSKYTFHEDSLMSLGYTYSMLRNDDTKLDGYQDFNKHDGFLSVSYRFLPEWKTILNGRYIRGLYDVQDATTTTLSRDLVQYVGDMSLESYVFSKNILSLSYAYIGTKYDEITQNDSAVHQAILGWKQEISPRMKFDLGGGPSSVKVEGQDKQWGYNAHAKINYSIEHGKLGIGAEKGYEYNNFSGTTDGGLIDFWKIMGDFTYELYKGFSCGLFASYKDEDHKNSSASSASTSISTANSDLDPYTNKIYEAGIKTTYNFWRYYTVTVGYTYSRQNSDTSKLIDFDDHRVYLSLGAEKEFWRW